MPRIGRELTKAQIWTLLTNITDELATLSAEVGSTKKAVEETAAKVGGFVQASEETERWQDENMAVISSKVPKTMVPQLDAAISKLDPLQWTRSSLVCTLLRNFIARQHADEFDFQCWLSWAQKWPTSPTSGESGFSH